MHRNVPFGGMRASEHELCNTKLQSRYRSGSILPSVLAVSTHQFIIHFPPTRVYVNLGYSRV